MKRTILAGLTLCGTLAGAFGQGSIFLTDGNITPGLALGAAGNYYSGTFGIQVFELNSSTLPSNINPWNGVSGSVGYANMLSDGYKLEATFANQSIPAGSAGVFSFGEVKMPDVSPAGSAECIALVAWDTGANSFSGLGGVITFINPTSDYTVVPQAQPAFLTGWDALGQDLIMAVPEPSMFTLAGMGATAFVMFRRSRSAKKQS